MPKPQEEDVKPQGENLSENPSADEQEEEYDDPDDNRGESLFDDPVLPEDEGDESDDDESSEDEGDDEEGQEGEEPADEVEEDSDEEETPSPDEELKKYKEQVQNLNKALAAERSKNRTVQQPKDQEKSEDDSQEKGDLPMRLVKAQEKLAFKKLHTEFPELDPVNDVGDVVWQQFVPAYTIIAQDYERENGNIPLTKEEIYEVGKQAMEYLEYKSGAGKRREQAKVVRAKSQAANLGSSSKSRPRKVVTATTSDRKRARIAGMSVEDYMKNKDLFEDGIY